MMIRDRQVLVVDENNKLTGPHETRRVLQSLDPETQSLRMVSRPGPNPAPDQPRFAICRVVDKRVEKEREKVQEKARKETARKLARFKVLELNWAIAPHDLGHRMKQMKGFLEKGYKVEVLFAKKKGSRRATRDEAEALVQAVRDAVAEVGGAKEWKESEGSPSRSSSFIWTRRRRRRPLRLPRPRVPRRTDRRVHGQSSCAQPGTGGKA
ncbi:translation initiation factor IF-3 [Colletotrichum higginsianum]|nr:translation initiation factor IF-3 [Colletotrichum higginsianum]